MGELSTTRLAPAIPAFNPLGLRTHCLPVRGGGPVPLPCDGLLPPWIRSGEVPQPALALTPPPAPPLAAGGEDLAQKLQGISWSAVGNRGLFIEPEAGAAPLLSAIKNAQQSISVKIYMLSSKPIMDELKAAAARGVDVRVILETAPFTGGGGNNLNKKAVDYLKDSQVRLSWSDPRFVYTHEKSMVVDGKVAFICNSNWTASSFVDRRDYNVVTKDPAEVRTIQAIFDADWEHRPFVPSASGLGDLVLSPINARARLEDIISQARTSLKVQFEVVGDERIKQLLIAKATDQANPVKVQLIVPDHMADKAKELAAAGLDVRLMKAPVLHAKMIIRDGVEAYTGSVNLTTNSMERNRELGLIQSLPDLVGPLASTFDADWAKATPVTADMVVPAMGHH